MEPTPPERISERRDRKRIPVSVILIAGLYLTVGVVGFVAHFGDRTHDWLWVEGTELIAILCGVFLLLARRWARWLTIAWMAFHVAISYDDGRKLAIHGLFLLLIVWGLFSANAKFFFRSRAVPGADP